MSTAAIAVERAQKIADRVLFPSALETDRSDLVPASHLDALAKAELYGIAGPLSAGGLALDTKEVAAVIEALASGCLATAFVFLQHQSVVRTVANSGNQELRDAWLAKLCAGELRAGIALGGIRPGPQQLRAEPAEGGWLLNGPVPWVTGWGRVDAVLAAALTSDGRVVRALVDGQASPSLHVKHLELLAATASGTVLLDFKAHFVPNTRVALIEPFVLPPAHDGGGRVNGSLALGVANRCLRLIGPSPLDAELVARRRQLDEANDETMAQARAAASELAFRASARLVVFTGSRALLPDNHAQRLAREALFLLVFGTRAAIRSALLEYTDVKGYPGL